VAWPLAPPPGPDPAAWRSWQALRNRSAVALQLGAGLTPSDVRAVLAREAPIVPWCGRLLRSWLHVRREVQIERSVLFPATCTSRPWGKVSQYASAQAVLAAAGVPDSERGSFKLRHTCALRQLRRGTAPEQVAQWLGLPDAAALALYRRVLLAPVEVV
jgi:integrase